MVRPGMIFFSNNKKTLFAKLIRFFTHSKISHSGLITFDLNGIPACQEETMLVQVVPWANYDKSTVDDYYLVYKIKDGLVSEADKQKALRYCFTEYAGVQYGYLQILWFVWRWFAEKVLRKDVTHKKNWFTDGVVCSELVYVYLLQLGIISGALAKFNSDTVQAEDLLQIVKSNPEIFEKVIEKQK
jgi:hypothetical protein